jgi:hypothetical protein
LGMCACLSLFCRIFSVSCTSTPYVTVASSEYSFDVRLNGSQTTFGSSGYTAIAQINSMNTSTLKPDVPVTRSGVTTTMSVWNEDCHNVVAEFTLVNTGSNAAIVGVCVHADTYVGSDSVNWGNLEDKHGIYTPSYPFYIQATEAFSGTYAGAESPRADYCSSTNTTLSTGVDSGIAVNWNNVTVAADTTRVFRMLFSNYPVELSCTSDLCSSCSSSSSCHSLSNDCYYSELACYNSRFCASASLNQ